ncbi:MAG: hypothetical protein QGG42_00650 [Phycisphaerae bacterium]|jgi:hypothetical protein|nr:hypothetical protein [Phycisphaerae bacterium]
MRKLSRTLLLLLAPVAAAANLHCNDSREAEYRPAAAYISSAAYIRVSASVDEQPMLAAVTETYALMATTRNVLDRSISADRTEDGRNRDRIRKTSYFTGDILGTIKNLQKDLRVTAVPGSNLIRVSLKSAKPIERADIVNAVADAIVNEAVQQRKRTVSMQMKYTVTASDELRADIAAKRKMIAQLRGQSQVPLMKEERASLQNSLTLLSNSITSLRLKKNRIESDLGSFKDKQTDNLLMNSPEIRFAVANDPSVATLRAAILQSKISALGDNGNKQLITIQKRLAEMLTLRQQAAAREAISLKRSKLESEAAAVSYQLLAIGNQYNEVSARLRDLGVSLTRIEYMQSEIERVQQQADELDDELFRLRISLGDNPLTIWAYAEISS